MLIKETDQSPTPAIEPWMQQTEFTFNVMPTTTAVLPKSSTGLPVPSSPGQPISSSALPASSNTMPNSRLSQPVLSPKMSTSSPGLPVSSQGLPVSSQGLPVSSPGLPVSSPALPLASPGLPTSAILSPSQIKQEPMSSILVNELLSRETISNTCYSIMQLKNSGTPNSAPSIVVCKREPSDGKVEHHRITHCNGTSVVRVKEEYPDLCDMVGVDKTTYLEFLNNPIMPSISEVEQLLEQCSDCPGSLASHGTHGPHCRPHHNTPECVQSMPDFHPVIKTERNHMSLMSHHDSSLSPTYHGSYMDTSFSDDDPSLWHPTDLTTLLPLHGHDPKRHDVKSDVTWHDVSNGGYDSSGPIESPRSTGSVESDEAESRLPTAVENMEDVGAMTSQMEESNRLTFDDDFGSFDVDEKAFKKRRKGLHLWEFLLEVLDDDRYVPHLLYWVERSKGIFKIEKSQEVAKLWGRRKQRSHMTYEHMSRAMRHYYSSGIMRRIPGKRLMYQFGPRAFATCKSSS